MCSNCVKKSVEMNEDFCSQEVWEPQSVEKVELNTFIKILIKSNIEEAFLTIEMANTSSNNKVNIMIWTGQGMMNKIQLQTLTIIRFNLLVRAAEEQDILSLPGIKLGNPVSPKTVNLVTNFYLSDEFS